MGVGNLTNILDMPQLATRYDEQALVAELRAGSDEAFAWLIQQYHGQVYALLARSLGDREAAADTTQEVFLKVFRGIQTFQGESSLRTWIYRIALHEASNGRRWWHRHKRREVTLDSEACTHSRSRSRSRSADAADAADLPTLGEQLMAVNATPLEAAVTAELRLRMEDALAQIAAPFRTAVLLRDVEGFSYEEMAEIMQVSLGTVKSRIVRGRSALREKLKQDRPKPAPRYAVKMETGA